MFKKLEPIIQEAMESHHIVGASIIIAKESAVVFENNSGWADREAEKKVNSSTIFRLASMTKPIVSAAALALVDKGLLTLDDPVTQWLPFFTPKLKNGEAAMITVRHLLMHTSGLSYGFLTPDNEPYHSAGVSDGIDESVLSLDENLRRLATVPLLFEPGTSWRYSLSTDVLGAVLEKAVGKSLPEIVAEEITGPLGMHDTNFRVKETGRLACAYADSHEPGGIARLMKDQDQVILPGCGPIHYAPGRILNEKAYASGGAGMAGTARDYLKLLEAIRQGDLPFAEQMSTDALPPHIELNVAPGHGFGMGFAIVRDSAIAGTPRRRGTYHWGGVYGNQMFVDPSLGLSVVILTNTALGGWGFAAKLTASLYRK
jgi:CubicO group peptidase (beta-lactamase class C family)